MEHACRFIDEYHTEVGRNLTISARFAERMEKKTGNRMRPKPRTRPRITKTVNDRRCGDEYSGYRQKGGKESGFNMVLEESCQWCDGIENAPESEKTAKACRFFFYEIFEDKKRKVQQIKEMNGGRLPALQPKGKDHETIGGILIGCQPESRKGF